ncbi:MAG TPA: DegT/DnrJ/EryC1/StrS aminotransferase family protein [Gammaproteobacteria bacterium]|nr:DegT/DnrJ/EryC1/StrS aminotransferase family protein [Gammaproteobacteria bacterium]
MSMADGSDSTLQIPLPERFNVHPLIQPQWRLTDMSGPHNGGMVMDELKQELCRQYGVKYCVPVDRARSGIWLVSQALRLRGAWMSASFMHRPTGVLLANLASSLQFVDIGDDFNIDPDAVEAAVTKDTEVLFVTHMFGKAAKMERLRAIADRYGLVMIENAVHMAGNIDTGGRRLGSWGDAAVVSFNVDKPVGGILGGALLTNREDIYRAASALKLSAPDYREVAGRLATTYLAYRLKPQLLRVAPFVRNMREVDAVSETEAFALSAYQSYVPRRINRIQALVALAGLRRLNEYQSLRRRNAQRLSSRIAGLPGIRVPQTGHEAGDGCLYYPVRLVDSSLRYQFGWDLARSGIETKWRYYPLHRQPGFENCPHGDLPVTEAAWKDHLVLPIGPSTSLADIDRMADAITDVIPRRAES